MNKADLVSQIAESAGLTKIEAEKSLKSMLETIVTALANEETVTFVGFGSFSVTTRAARTGRNPQTGKEIQIAEKKVVKFNVGKNLKESLCEIKTKAGCGCGSKTSKAKKK
ncbi:MAG: HU family DNA-binding protein [Deltaproteobacteria bacterium]|jgi:DNA-binding protein HU-beta|nr:HU family DNA-binding protein [Deltaproteobacteria bacterium]